MMDMDLLGERWVLHPHRALFWSAKRCLVVSDLHLGKAAHLRKGGLAMPEAHDDRTLQRLSDLLATFRPERLLILGDLFHSAHNLAWPSFASWALDQPCRIELVPGNHDVLAHERDMDAGLIVHDEQYGITPFVMMHDAGKDAPKGTMSGHVHPGIVLSGPGRQRITVPAFLISEERVLLPAFGTSTGLHPVTPRPEDRVFACTEREVIEVTSAVAPRTAAHR